MASHGSADNPTKARLMAEMDAARKGLQYAKTLLSAASAQAQTLEADQPDSVRALTLATAEYDSAINQYNTAVNNFADFILNQQPFIDRQ